MLLIDSGLQKCLWCCP